ncbi:pyrroloquinoline quinone biosynthesis protein PqqE [Rhodospirillum sp. A1_3_36]|uniref:pyrroloquinoline quinone biosynthesis protein PqqE n=1 Tax=Rhodospirillum sp. A1_3_36 TaxID=3391666 RepID=UPI0039A470DE
MLSHSSAIRPPIAMLAELTHRCPLSCPYCSNPLELTAREAELSASDWREVFAQAGALGVLQVHLSGGEPAARRDLVELVAAAREAKLYTNLITSGVGLTRERLGNLEGAGLDHVQLSLQGTDEEMADRIGGYKGGFGQKLRVAGWVAEIGLPLTLNVVVHRLNLHQVPDAIDMAVSMGARRVEIAIVQFHGWALRNRAALMPTREQAARTWDIVEDARARLKGVLVIDHVAADYHTEHPKRCMDGWGRTGFTVTPEGLVLPCHAAQTIPGMAFDSVRDRPLAEIWTEGHAFNAFRGDDWMREPCRSCERKGKDFGGCRCQALAMTGDARNADPVCVKSPYHGVMRDQALGFSSSEGVDFLPRG